MLQCCVASGYRPRRISICQVNLAARHHHQHHHHKKSSYSPNTTHHSHKPHHYYHTPPQLCITDHSATHQHHHTPPQTTRSHTTAITEPPPPSLSPHSCHADGTHPQGSAGVTRHHKGQETHCTATSHSAGGHRTPQEAPETPAEDGLQAF